MNKSIINNRNSTNNKESIITYTRNYQLYYLNLLKTFLAIPSISTKKTHTPDIQQAAKWLTDTMDLIGLNNIKIYPTPGHPIVYGEWLKAGPNAPTILFYGHYDVQPANNVDKWDTPPFKATIVGDDIFARGATDNKGQLFTHLAAVDSILRVTEKLPVNVKFMLEGEEEIGSTHLDQFIAENTNLLQADCAIISDTPFVAAETPTIIYGLRGLVAFEIEVQSSSQNLHSGMYGGIVHNPLNALAKIIAAMHNKNGTITIPGFYDDVLPLTNEDRELLAELPDTFLAKTGAKKLWGEAEFNPRERITSRPTLDVHGIYGGYVGEGMKTIIPANASAKISMRLVPNQDPNKVIKQFTDYIKTLTPDTIQTNVTVQAKGAAALIDRSDPAILAASIAYKAAFATEPLFSREGGAIPVVPSLQHHLNIPVVLMGFGLPDDNLHAPNEKFHLPNFYRGIETSIHFMYEYADLKHSN